MGLHNTLVLRSPICIKGTLSTDDNHLSKPPRVSHDEKSGWDGIANLYCQNIDGTNWMLSYVTETGLN